MKSAIVAIESLRKALQLACEVCWVVARSGRRVQGVGGHGVQDVVPDVGFAGRLAG